MAINERIVKLENFYKKEKKIGSVGKAMGFKGGSFQSLKKENANPTLNSLIKILEYDSDINPMWLFLGEGKMFKSQAAEKDTGIAQLKEQVEAIKKEVEGLKKGENKTKEALALIDVMRTIVRQEKDKL